MDGIDDLSERFWAWRARQQPRQRDDIPRLVRPAGWLPEVDPDLAARRREELAGFQAELAALRPAARAASVPDRVDHRLLRSAMSRVIWENDVLGVRHIPRFWIDQAIGPVFDALLPPGVPPGPAGLDGGQPEVDAARVAEVIRLLRAVPATLSYAPAALTSRPRVADGGALRMADSGAPRVAAREFADLALAELADIGDRITACADALARWHPPAAADLAGAAAEAASAFRVFDTALKAAHPTLPAASAVGREQYEWFLREVACVPLDADEIAAVGRREYDRAVWLELLHANVARNVPPPRLPASAAEQVRAEAEAEGQVRRFYAERGLLSQPVTLRHYLNLPMPGYLEPLRFLGVTDDLTGPGRLDEDGVSYVPEPSPELPYFWRANAYDPRAGIIHEGVHYQQLARSWRNPRPVRRHYYDSGVNEGIAFYNEEMMLASGLFDDAPHTRVVVCNFMRLRALRVIVDVGLATGRMSIAEAAGELATRVPVDKETAQQEAAFFTETPGQALTYQIGKTQLIGLVADAARSNAIDLAALHDAIWDNGNVPIALLRWELLGRTDELAAIDAD